MRIKFPRRHRPRTEKQGELTGRAKQMMVKTSLVTTTTKNTMREEHVIHVTKYGSELLPGMKTRI